MEDNLQFMSKQTFKLTITYVMARHVYHFTILQCLSVLSSDAFRNVFAFVRKICFCGSCESDCLCYPCILHANCKTVFFSFLDFHHLSVLLHLIFYISPYIIKISLVLFNFQCKLLEWHSG
jgi:hypothetical protein